MKILNVIDIPWHSALAAYAFDQSRAMSDKGHQVFIAAPEGSAAQTFALENRFTFTAIPDRKSYCVLPSFFRLKRLIEREDIDLINAHTGKAQTLAWALSFCTKKQFAIIRTKADAATPSNSFTFSKVSKVIAASGVIKQMYKAAGLESSKIEVIYQGIDPPPTAEREPGPVFNIGILARLDPVKGHSDFLEAAALILKSGIAAEFLIAGGEGNIQFETLKKQAIRLGIADKIKYAGLVRDQFSFINACDLGVIASVGSEVVSRALLEWMAAGKPIVATAVGSIPEMLPSEFIVPPSVPAALAEKISGLLRTTDLRAAAGQKNREIVLTRFAKQNFSDLTEQIFHAAIASANIREAQ